MADRADGPASERRATSNLRDTPSGRWTDYRAAGELLCPSGQDFMNAHKRGSY
jgi:hypothetical protein